MDNTEIVEQTEPMELAHKNFFSAKNVALMAIFGALSSLIGLTTNYIPAYGVPGLFAVIAIPASTILTLTARELVGRTGAATFTQFISGAISTFLPTGMPVPWIILPMWISGGVVIDLFYYLTRKKVSDSRLATGIVGFIYEIPADFILFWAFNIFAPWGWDLTFFLWAVLLMHSLLGGITAIFVPDIIDRISPAIY
jgi:hypothetical protein